MNTNTTIVTAATVEAAMRAIITAPGGEQVIRCSEAALKQMVDVSKAMAEMTGFTENRLDDLELTTSMSFIKVFNKDLINGDVIDGTLMPTDQKNVDGYIARFPEVADLFTPGVVYPAMLIAKILNEVKQFTR